MKEKKIIILFVFIIILASNACAQNSISVYYVKLTEGQEITANPVKHIEATGKKGKLVQLYPEITFQTIEGVGGAFNEIGGEALMSLSEEQQNEIMNNLFSEDAAHFSLCRTAIGASDFGFDAYSYSEVPNDYKMEKFSIERERKSVIPYIQMAYKYNPEMELFASPWSPPGWMKESGLMDKGNKDKSKNRLKNDPKIYKAYALYFSKYVQAYSNEGIKVNKIVVQNEQDHSTKYPSCNMTPQQMGEFIINYMRPQFEKDRLKAEIWAGTFRTPKQLDGLEFVRNKKWFESVDGIGIQYTEPWQIANYKTISPDIKLLHTEGICFNGANTIEQAFSRFEEIASYINYGVPNYCYWNMILNESGKSGWGWKQNSLINIDRKNKSITYNPDYAVIALFSKFMQPNMKRIAVANHNEVTLALSDEKNVYVFLKNDTENTKSYTIFINRKRIKVIEIPARSVSVAVVSIV